MFTNKNDANTAAILNNLAVLRGLLETERQSPATSGALEQCRRLELAITQSHAEGVRFAAFTLLRLVQHNPTAFADTVRSATQQLETALDTAGYHH